MGKIVTGVETHQNHGGPMLTHHEHDREGGYSEKAYEHQEFPKVVGGKTYQDAAALEANQPEAEEFKSKVGEDA